MQKNSATLESKSKHSLNYHEIAWNLKDISQLGAITDEIVEDINKDYPAAMVLSKAIETLSDDVQNRKILRVSFIYFLTKKKAAFIL
jgi:hypothetical protein